ncbi:hypothetical protein BDF20DRAFT_838271 [Mycotypha africana]|uniref:uncharacterized protein n=1 Tax=Mycotypha africana TaxID=64632 RepID=UPI002300CB68|nr:uncharacterized protein BDF20DRAFT_838271 [Mycotypha africana]KAI8972006.1 hypothetical protein BDF20DRAFT_838271 [Mycotypha africana]
MVYDRGGLLQSYEDFLLLMIFPPHHHHLTLYYKAHTVMTIHTAVRYDLAPSVTALKSLSGLKRATYPFKKEVALVFRLYLIEEKGEKESNTTIATKSFFLIPLSPWSPLSICMNTVLYRISFNLSIFHWFHNKDFAVLSVTSLVQRKTDMLQVGEKDSSDLKANVELATKFIDFKAVNLVITLAIQNPHEANKAIRLTTQSIKYQYYKRNA